MYFVNNETGFIKHIDGDTTWIFSSESVEGVYEKYLAWVEDGNTAEEWVTE